jgi:hypothetical protein
MQVGQPIAGQAHRILTGRFAGSRRRPGRAGATTWETTDMRSNQVQPKRERRRRRGKQGRTPFSCTRASELPASLSILGGPIPPPIGTLCNQV